MIDEYEQIDEAVHACPGCGYVEPRRRHVCDECWRDAPWRLKARLAWAWRRRVRDPVAYQESLAGLLQWCHDRCIREWAVGSWITEPIVYVYRR